MVVGCQPYAPAAFIPRDIPGTHFVKWLGRGIKHPSPSTTEVKERVDLHLYSLWAFMACYRETFTLITMSNVADCAA